MQLNLAGAGFFYAFLLLYGVSIGISRSEWSAEAARYRLLLMWARWFFRNFHKDI
ncbi:hypothetical protein [Pseudomonas monsensis]|uniref:hypothetical protein n=1 Tax=Pseudomonas monsensis TaxID=2745509 RepID=UPI003D25F850